MTEFSKNRDVQGKDRMGHRNGKMEIVTWLLLWAKVPRCGTRRGVRYVLQPLG